MTPLAPLAPASEKRAANMPPDIPAPAKPVISAQAEANGSGHPMPAPWRLDLLADTGETAHTHVPNADDPDGWDQVEALVSSALAGLTYRPAGRTRRSVGRPLEAHDG